MQTLNPAHLAAVHGGFALVLPPQGGPGLPPPARQPWPPCFGGPVHARLPELRTPAAR